MTNEINMFPPKGHSSSITKSKDTEMVKIKDKEFESLVSKMINISKGIQTNI
jgi:hypothetical protein